MDQKKYVDIERLKDKYAMAFKAGEHITVSEKIDGANASIRYDAETGSLAAFSRRQRLTEDNNLQGFYVYVLTLDPVKWADVTSNGRFIVFGEWLVKHTIKYPDDLMRKFYVFDVWDTEVEQYVPWFLTYQIAQALGLKTVPIFYDGEFTSWEDLYALVGRTEMQAEPTGEGIVIKSQDRLDNKFSGTPAYVKIVAKEFSEVHQSKPQKEIDPAKIAAKQAAEAQAETIVTQRRVEKIIQKFVEDNLVREDWDEKDLGAIAKILPRAAYEDCVKEEPETVAQIENFGKLCAQVAMKHARNLVK
jgi:hypothetical protein